MHGNAGSAGANPVDEQPVTNTPIAEYLDTTGLDSREDIR